jgi:hypothetical protein
VPVQDAPGPRRRGRVATGPAVRTGPVGEFAYRLWELKKKAGDPSYDRMRSEFGALASKSALSAAARGQRLPSWETAWEFVRSLEVGVLGGDVDAVRRRWREHWENAAALSDDTTEPIDVPEPPEIQLADATEEERAPQGKRRRFVWLAAVGLIGVTVLVVIVLVIVIAGFRWQGLATGHRLAPAPELAVRAPNQVPAIREDASAFVGDVTVPDGTQVPRGGEFVKTWEIRNAGAIRWAGRYLRRNSSGTGPDPCTSEDRVPIPPTQPGQNVRISVTVRAPSAPGWCQEHWTMVDARGLPMLPGDQALFFVVEVV